MPATVTLVTGSGTTRTAAGYSLTRWPWVFLGGSVDTRTITTSTGTVTYYGLDNSTTEVLRLGCFRDIVLEPQYNEYDDYCDGVLIRRRNLSGYTGTLTITQDVVDLYFLRKFMRQSSSRYAIANASNLESLTIGDMVTDVIPVLFEHHYEQASSSADEYIGILAFEAEISLGAYTGNYDEGWSAEMTIDVRYSDTYSAYLALVRYDDVLVT